MEKKGQESFLNNISWIFIGNIIHAVFSFAINILVARSLTTNDNGILNYAASWISFYTAVASLGINSVINKYTTSNLDESNKYLTTAVGFRIVSGIISIVMVYLTIKTMNPGDKTVLSIAVIQSMAILFSAGDTLVFWFQYKRQSKMVALLRLYAFILSAIIRITSIVIFHNIFFYAFGLVFEQLCFSILLIIKYRNIYSKKIDMSSTCLRQILKCSYPFIFSAILATVYSQIDKVMLKNMMGNSAVAYYSIAVTLAGLMSIVVSALIDGFRPEIITAKSLANELEYERKLRQIYCITFWICICYGVFITLFGKTIIEILYGDKYLPSLPALSLIVWYTFFSYFGTINNIYMVSESVEKWVQLTTFVGALVNVILNMYLIPCLGIKGAALASLLTQFIANFAIPALIPSLRKINVFICQAIIFKNVL